MHKFKQIIKGQSFQNGAKTVAAFIVVGLLGASITLALPRPRSKPVVKPIITLATVKTSTSQDSSDHNSPTSPAPQPSPEPPTNQLAPVKIIKKTLNPPAANTPAAPHIQATQSIELPIITTPGTLNDLVDAIKPTSLTPVPPVTITINPTNSTATLAIKPTLDTPQTAGVWRLVNYILSHPGTKLSVDDVLKLLQG